VPFPAGSSPDLIARILAEKLPQSLDQAVVVENRPGAGGNLGRGLVAKAAPDGVGETSNESNSMNQLDGSILMLAYRFRQRAWVSGMPEKSEVHDETTPVSRHCSTRIRRLRLSAQVGTGDDGRRRRPRKDGRY